MKRLFDTVAEERNLLFTTMNQMYPGLAATMESDMDLILKSKDSATQEELTEKFKNTYYGKVSNVWYASGVSQNTIKAKYTFILGNISFKLTEFGGISMIDSLWGHANYLPNDPPPIPFPDDSVISCDLCPLRWESGVCGGITPSSITRNDADRTHIWIASAFAGACDRSFNVGMDFDVPAGRYRFITGKMTMNASPLHCTAFVLFPGGLGSSSATVSAVIEANGVVINSCDLYSAQAYAPIVWWTESYQGIPNTPHYISTPGVASGLPAGNYKIYLKTRNTTFTAGLSAGAISSTFYTRQIEIRASR